MDERPDLQRLAEHLRVLANPNRLKLLYELRSPRSVAELELTPEKVPQGENPDRPISHQAVRSHLSKLQSIDVVSIRQKERDGHIADEHVLNHQRLFAIVEELRRLGELHTDHEAREEETIPADPGGGGSDRTTPHLLLVRGQREGRVFPLNPEDRTPGRGWVIGRKRGLAVALDYDPFVSGENTEIRDQDDGFVIQDLEESRNGTYVNFTKTPPTKAVPLTHGDLVTVGKTNLVFHDE